MLERTHQEWLRDWLDDARQPAHGASGDAGADKVPNPAAGFPLRDEGDVPGCDMPSSSAEEGFGFLWRLAAFASGSVRGTGLARAGRK